MSDTIGVAMVPGQTALMRMPRAAYSSAALRVSPEGLASLFMRGRLLAAVAPSRSLVNRACFVERGTRLPTFRAAHSVAGASHLRCEVPETVLVDLRDGDLIVRAPGGARFLLGAAVSDEHLVAAGHWSTDCEVAAGG